MSARPWDPPRPRDEAAEGCGGCIGLALLLSGATFLIVAVAVLTVRWLA